jgi:hypothetical protein
MSKRPRRDPAETLRALYELADDVEEMESILRMSEVDLDDRLRSAGIPPESVPGLAKETVKRADRDFAAAASAKVVPLLAAKKRTHTMAWIGSAVALAAGAAVVAGTKLQSARDHAGPEAIGPDLQGMMSPQERAAKLRDEAAEECRLMRWAACEDKLDDARKLDPAGEDQPAVKELRAKEQAGQYPDGGPDKKR